MQYKNGRSSWHPILVVLPFRGSSTPWQNRLATSSHSAKRNTKTWKNFMWEKKPQAPAEMQELPVRCKENTFFFFFYYGGCWTLELVAQTVHRVCIPGNIQSPMGCVWRLPSFEHRLDEISLEMPSHVMHAVIQWAKKASGDILRPTNLVLWMQGVSPALASSWEHLLILLFPSESIFLGLALTFCHSEM